MATHSNNVETAPAPDIHNKRVSFGGEEHVQMIVYDDGLTEDYSINNKHNGRHPPAFTEPDAPPSRVKVIAEQAQIPRPISPPAQIAPQPSTPMNSGATAAATSAAADAPVAGPAHLVNSPPLPSLMKKQEHENENPFRPDEQLYHEVDPIVEMYRQRPFPPSPSHGSPVPPHQQQQRQSNASQTQQGSTPARTSQPYAANGGSGRHSSLAEARRGQPGAAEEEPLLTDGIGPPGKAEVIRLEEKKKRACCSLQ